MDLFHIPIDFIFILKLSIVDQVGFKIIVYILDDYQKIIMKIKKIKFTTLPLQQRVHQLYFMMIHYCYASVFYMAHVMDKLSLLLYL